MKHYLPASVIPTVIARILILTLVVSALACKDDTTSDSIERERVRLDSLMRASKAQQKKMETEEELAERVRRSLNTQFSSSDTIFFKSEVQFTRDTAITALLLKGKYGSKTDIHSFELSAITYKGVIAKGLLPGRIFRSQALTDSTYLFYSREEHQPGITAAVLNTYDIPTLTTTEATGNYYFDLLTTKKHKPTLNHPEKFFITQKGRQLVKDSLLKAGFPHSSLYLAEDQLMPQGVTPPYRVLISKDSAGFFTRLIAKPNDSTIAQIILSGQRISGPNREVWSSEFVNDSLLRQQHIRQVLVKDHPHLVTYRTDTINRSYRYKEDFVFSPEKADSSSYYQHYPQYYTHLEDSVFTATSDTFTLDNKKVFWKYTISYRNNSTTENVNVTLRQKDLVEAENESLIFRIPSYGFKARTTLTEIFKPQEVFPARDLNFDGYPDLAFQNGNDNNQNPLYNVYIYSPEYQKFSRTPALDGTSVFGEILTDSTSGLIVHSGRTDRGHMSFSLTDPNKPDSRKIYWTSGPTDHPAINYQQLENKVVTEKHIPLIDSIRLNPVDQRLALLEWILQQERKRKQAENSSR